MASHESLNDGQRAVLQLLLRQGRSYDDLAGLLGTDSSGVRARAFEAVEALAPVDAGVGPDRRREIADYLLGQQGTSQRAATREYLEDSVDGRAWARPTAAALRPLAGEGALPDIPAEREAVAPAFDAAATGTAADPEDVRRSSQLGGRLIAVGLGLVVAIVIIVAAKPFSSDGDRTTSAATPPAPTSTATSTAGGTGTTPSGDRVELRAQGELKPPDRTGSKASGQVAIVSFPENNRFRLALTVKELPPSSTRGSIYGVWFYTSPSRRRFVGFPDTVVGPDGKLEAVADLDPNTPIYREVLLTRERSERPKRPGTIILRAKLRTAQTPAQGRGGRTTTTP